MEEIELSCYHTARRRAPLSTASFSPFASTGAEGPHPVHMMIPTSFAARYIFSGGIAHSSLNDQPKSHAMVGDVASSVSFVEVYVHVTLTLAWSAAPLRSSAQLSVWSSTIFPTSQPCHTLQARLPPRGEPIALVCLQYPNLVRGSLKLACFSLSDNCSHISYELHLVWVCMLQSDAADVTTRRLGGPGCFHAWHF